MTLFSLEKQTTPNHWLAPFFIEVRILAGFEATLFLSWSFHP